MISNVYFLYFCTWLLVALSPGPAVMYSMEQSSRYGFKSSLFGIAGIQSGNLLFFAGAAFGLASFVAVGTAAFSILRVVGAGYLFYLGIRIIVSSLRGRVISSPRLTLSVDIRILFIRGMMIQVTNPKALLFMSALLPQFIDSRARLLHQLGFLAGITVMVDLIVLSSYAYLAAVGAASFKRSGVSAWLERAFGAALIFFGVRLLTKK